MLNPFPTITLAMKMPLRYGSENESYRYGFNGMESDDEVYNQEGNSYTTELRQYDSRIGRWFSPDPLKQFEGSQYSSFANNPILLTDPSGGWVPKVNKSQITTVDSDGNKTTKQVGHLALEYEEGDDANSLAEMLNIDLEEATKLYNNSVFEGEDSTLRVDIKVPESIAGPINLQIQDYLDNPSNYDGFLDGNYNCWNSCISISQATMPATDGNSSSSTNSYLNEGIEFTRLLNDDSKYENVSGSDAIKFGKTVIRVAEDVESILGYSYNRTTHGAVYLGKSRDGTQYVWTKNGWSKKPKVATLEETLELYDGSKVQGGGEKKNEGGYYNYIGE